MEKLPKPFRIDFEDGTSGNFVKVEPITPQQHILERISGMKYGRKNVEKHTWDIVATLEEKHPNIFSSMPKIFQAAESVLINYYAKYRKSILLYDIDRDEYSIYLFEGKNSTNGYAIRITRILRRIIDGENMSLNEVFANATFDFKGVLESLSNDLQAALKMEDYDKVRDVVAGMNKISKELE